MPEKGVPAPFWGPPGQFFAWAGKIKKLHKFCPFSLVGPWALFTRFGALAAIHPRWGNRYTTMLTQKQLWIWKYGVPKYLLPHLGWIAARAPNRVNRAHGPTKENRQNLGNFWIFPAHAKNGPGGPQMGPGRFFPALKNIPDILGRTDFDFEIFIFIF